MVVGLVLAAFWKVVVEGCHQMSPLPLVWGGVFGVSFPPPHVMLRPWHRVALSLFHGFERGMEGETPCSQH